jgi:hypothetical protein
MHKPFPDTVLKMMLREVNNYCAKVEIIYKATSISKLHVYPM